MVVSCFRNTRRLTLQNRQLSTSVAPWLSDDRTRLQLADGWDLPVIPLSELGLDRLDRISAPRRNQDDPRNQRFVYRDAEHGNCVKVWSPQYALAAEFVHALGIGFYDRTLCGALTGVVVGDDLASRGYVMREGVLMKHSVPESLLRHLLQRSISTGHFYYDLVRCVIEIRGGYSLIDLEGVYRFSALAPFWRARLIGKRTGGCVASPLSYHRVLSRLQRLLHRSADPVQLHHEIDRSVAGLPFVVRGR